MTTSALIIVLFIFILSGLIVLRPFLDQERGVQRSGGGVYDSLLAEQERLLSAIEELDLDLALQKISVNEHAQDRKNLLKQAAEVLRELDKYGKPQAAKAKQDKLVSTGDEELEKLIQNRRKEIQAKRTEVCSSCGEKIGPEDQFCSHCGKKQ